LRDIGKTEEVPFIGVFVTDSVDEQLSRTFHLALPFIALLGCKENPKLLEALETKEGFTLDYKTDGWEFFPIEKAEGDSKN
jgi:hypothetical protein